MKGLMNTVTKLLLFLSVCGIADAQNNGVTGADRDAAAGSVSAIAPLPSGTSTILGGAIGNVDPVLDRFTLKIMGEKPLRILYDERTQLFLDGKKTPLRELHAAEHASVQTVLDGTAVFALSIHVLSQLQQGDYRGEVVSYNPATGDLEVVSGKGGTSVTLHVSNDTTFSRTGQAGFIAQPASAADLQRGSLVSIRFDPDGKGHASVRGITFLATPGSRFVFIGSVIAFDMQGGTLVLLDPKDDQTYQIAFRPDIPGIQSVHNGQNVQITAQYDGTRYLAENVKAY